MATDWTKYSWNDFLDKTKDKDIVIWGCGEIASEVVYLLEKIRHIAYFVDRDLSKIGTDFYGRKIKLPDDVFDGKSDYVVLICSLYLTDIAGELERYGINEYFSAFFMMRKDLKNEIMTKIPSKELILELKSILSDKRSVQIVDKIIEKRQTGNIDYSDIMTKEEYFLDEIFTFTDKEIYVDAGAFDGDTVLGFIKKVREFKKVYSFEADKNNFDKMLLRLQLAEQVYGKDKINCFNAALADYTGKISFLSLGNESSKVNKIKLDNGSKLDCMTLDSVVEDATYIKMDIEGSELDALKGAEKLIKSKKPKMAICIYHRSEDLWQIPAYIHTLVPEYKMFIRHHGNIYYDTVLYVTL